MLLPAAAILTLVQQCAPNVAPETMAALIDRESSGNPYAIGVVGMQLVDQPKNIQEALEAAQLLLSKGANISVGLGQVNKNNFKGLGITLEQAFEPCANITASSKVLTSCYDRAANEMGEGQTALKAALSCYYSNNFTRGFEKEAGDNSSYLMMIAQTNEKLRGVPAIAFKSSEIQETEPAKTESNGTTEQTKKPDEAPPAEAKPKTKDPAMAWDVLDDF